MLESFKRWFSRAPGASGWDSVAEWADTAGLPFKRTRDGEGFVVEASAQAQAWRMEWGPSQRSYLQGDELRLRADIGGGLDLQMLLASRSLLETFEKQVFEQFTEDLQTRIDTDTPEEMRWLVMFPKPAVLEGKTLREAFGGVANTPQALAQWLSGPLSDKLSEACETWLAPDEALALVVQRGRLTLRHTLAKPDGARVASVLSLYEVALTEARRVGDLWGPAADAPSTHPGLWNRTPVEPAGPKNGEEPPAP